MAKYCKAHLANAVEGISAKPRCAPVRRTLYTTAAMALVTGLGLTVPAGQAWALPDFCQPGSTTGTWICSGQQDQGIFVGRSGPEASLKSETIIVNNLTSDLGPIVDPTGNGAFVWTPQQNTIDAATRKAQFNTGSHNVIGRIGMFFSNASSTATAASIEVDLTGSALLPDPIRGDGGIYVDTDSKPGGRITASLTSAGSGPLTFRTPQIMTGRIATNIGSSGDIDLTVNSAVVQDTSQLAIPVATPFGLDLYTWTSGRGGNGGDVTLGANGGSLAIDIVPGNPSKGVLLSSQSGSGGTAGAVTIDQVPVAVTTAADNAHAISAFSTGGSGGTGGKGGTVSLTGKFSIDTRGADADGIVGGSFGGNGSGGGSGGDAGSATVTATSGSSVTTGGHQSTGIAMQSIGGRGGDGSSSKGVVAFGADGGSGGDGGFAHVINHGAVETSGNQAAGAIAQSLGGGGGSGGKAYGAFYSKGGSSGIGGDAGDAAVSNWQGTVKTHGHASIGLEAQSIGGTGGSGGGVGAGFSVGGRGGGGGSGGDVTVVNTGEIETGRNANVNAPASDDAACPLGCSYGILAQSIGGGGGNGGGSGGWFSVGGNGSNGGAGASATVTMGDSSTGANSITTFLNDSQAVMAQSIGGGGGNGGNAIGVGPIVSSAVGGKGRSGSHAGMVEVTLGETTLTTHGDRSTAIQAQSIGGGGGNGGYAIAASASIGTPDVSAAVGGSGGPGGYADTVTVKATETGNSISTSGNDSQGVLAQSVGGGGGNGGFAVSGAVSAGPDSGSVAVAVGGAGGSGSTSAAVTVTDPGTIATSGDRSAGIVAQSIGGGGGNGGMAISGAISMAGGNSVSVAVGGAASTTGGIASTVTVTSSDTISTGGMDATGILAQSIGGGGGNGGSAIAGNASIGGDDGAEIGVAVGRNAGVGGSSADVLVNNNANVTTAGVLSDGVVAQSIGGGGGKGGMAIAGSLNVGESNSFEVALGGGGGAGASASQVTVNANTGTVSATGDGARGIVAQSIGGGGGNGGMAITGTFQSNSNSKDFQLSIGGGAGSGSNGSSVNVTNDGAVSTGTVGAASDPASIAAQAGGHGILAQSIGGGGGSGGVSASGSLNRGNRNLAVGIGGSGGSGAFGGGVTVTNTGSVETNGAESDGILAQSIGGGGGNGGGTVAFDASTSKDAKTLRLNIGGAGGAGAVGGKASVDLSGANASVTAAGLGSRGVVVQSIGGGGGDGGGRSYYTNPKVSETVSKAQVVIGIGGAAGSGSGADTAQVTMNGGKVSTGNGIANPAAEGAEYEGHAIVVQSIGGGGGTGGSGFGGAKASSQDMTLTLGIGGSASKTSISDGGAALVGSSTTAITGTVTTTNYHSHGVLAQSIGGGGGTGGVGIAGDVKTTGAKALVAGIGGQGGAGGKGGAVSVYSAAAITVEGAGSKGIVAQGIGGGGGAGNTGISGKVTNASDEDGSKQLAFGLGGAGGGGGDGGTVLVSNTGAITTGAKATPGVQAEMDAIFAQSVGGGGGQSGIGINGDLATTGKGKNFELRLGISLSGGSGGDGKTVTVDNHGNLNARGDNARGIFAQSVGGGGGNGSAGIAGDISAPLNPAGTQADKQVDVALGGQSGPGGNGGAVNVTNTGTIGIGRFADGSATANTAGILAQSVGGGGGNAGVGLDGKVTGSKDSKALGVFLGGQGSAGGDGADVTVANSGVVTVYGDAGRGVHAQSIGGGGGNGGVGLNGTVTSGKGKTVSFALGQSGGSGGVGGDVSITNTGTVTTGLSVEAGDPTLSDAFGLFGQSVGGGGGTGVLTGGLAYGSTGDGTVKGIDFVVGGGSAQNTGNDGGEVVVVNEGGVTTYYDGSHAHFAQSVGGGGGHAGSIGGIATEDSSETWGATIGVGGDGSAGSGSKAHALMKPSTASATTHGDGAHGVFAQSVGGGGGTAANAAGQGDDATGQTTQNAKIGVTLGGSAGTSGDGGTALVGGQLDVNTGLILAGHGTVTTGGSHANGILAQSVGGGGGTAAEGLNTGVAGSFVQLGKDGADPTGNGGQVQVNFNGAVGTSGDSGFGILAQSVGGGGGYAGYVQLRDPTLWGAGSGLGMADGQQQDGSGSPVNVTLGQGGSVTTSGDDAVGIFAQTVGGGGGIQGTTAAGTSAAVGSAGGAGAAASIQVNVTGANVTTTGNWAHGVFMQAADGTAASSLVTKVNIGSNASVSASGFGASGIIAQRAGASVAAIGDNLVEVDIASGASVSGGKGSTSTASGKTAAVWVLDGALLFNGAPLNAVNNHGTVTSQDGAAGVAVQYTGSGGLAVNNFGTMTGTFQKNTVSALGSLTTGSSAHSEVVNHAGGLIVASGRSDVDIFTNHGRLEIGGVGNIDTLLHSAGADLFENKDGGVLALDLGGLTLPGTGYDQFQAFGQMGFELGSLIELTALPAFNPRVGMSFDLLVAEDIFFETEGQLGFDLFDYVSGSFLDAQLWDLSIELTDANILLSEGVVSAATAEALRLSYVGGPNEIPLPPGVWLGGSTVILFGTMMLRRRLRARR